MLSAPKPTSSDNDDIEAFARQLYAEAAQPFGRPLTPIQEVSSAATSVRSRFSTPTEDLRTPKAFLKSPGIEKSIPLVSTEYFPVMKSDQPSAVQLQDASWDSQDTLQSQDNIKQDSQSQSESRSTTPKSEHNPSPSSTHGDDWSEKVALSHGPSTSTRRTTISSLFSATGDHTQDSSDDQSLRRGSSIISSMLEYVPSVVSDYAPSILSKTSSLVGTIGHNNSPTQNGAQDSWETKATKGSSNVPALPDVPNSPSAIEASSPHSTRPLSSTAYTSRDEVSSPTQLADEEQSMQKHDSPPPALSPTISTTSSLSIASTSTGSPPPPRTPEADIDSEWPASEIVESQSLEVADGGHRKDNQKRYVEIGVGPDRPLSMYLADGSDGRPPFSRGPSYMASTGHSPGAEEYDRDNLSPSSWVGYLDDHSERAAISHANTVSSRVPTMSSRMTSLRRSAMDRNSSLIGTDGHPGSTDAPSRRVSFAPSLSSSALASVGHAPNRTGSGRSSFYFHSDAPGQLGGFGQLDDVDENQQQQPGGLRRAQSLISISSKPLPPLPLRRSSSASSVSLPYSSQSRRSSYASSGRWPSGNRSDVASVGHGLSDDHDVPPVPPIPIEHREESEVSRGPSLVSGHSLLFAFPKPPTPSISEGHSSPLPEGDNTILGDMPLQTLPSSPLARSPAIYNRGLASPRLAPSSIGTYTTSSGHGTSEEGGHVYGTSPSAIVAPSTIGTYTSSSGHGSSGGPDHSTTLKIQPEPDQEPRLFIFSSDASRKLERTPAIFRTRASVPTTPSIESSAAQLSSDAQHPAGSITEKPYLSPLPSNNIGSEQSMNTLATMGHDEDVEPGDYFSASVDGQEGEDAGDSSWEGASNKSTRDFAASPIGQVYLNPEEDTKRYTFGLEDALGRSQQREDSSSWSVIDTSAMLDGQKGNESPNSHSSGDSSGGGGGIGKGRRLKERLKEKLHGSREC